MRFNSNLPREKISEKNATVLKDYEVLAVLLRTGYRGKNVFKLAKEILRKYSLKEIGESSFQRLVKIKGIGQSRASVIIAALELGRRVFLKEKDVVIATPEDVVKVTNDLRYKKREYLVGLYLNARNSLITKQTISIGTLNANLVHPREVFIPALKHYAAQVIIVHNHPSGNPQPSEEDIRVTQRLVKAGELIDIEVIDHIIVSGNDYFSFKRKKLF